VSLRGGWFRRAATDAQAAGLPLSLSCQHGLLTPRSAREAGAGLVRSPLAPAAALDVAARH